jgi:hypothetical protein
MNEPNLSDQEADAINEQMVAAMEQRRQRLPNRRQSSDDRQKRPVVERRRICGYCFQRGDHATAAHCMRALERASSD